MDSLALGLVLPLGPIQAQVRELAQLLAVAEPPIPGVLRALCGVVETQLLAGALERVQVLGPALPRGTAPPPLARQRPVRERVLPPSHEMDQPEVVPVRAPVVGLEEVPLVP